jgi:chromosome segregation ATPase
VTSNLQEQLCQLTSNLQDHARKLDVKDDMLCSSSKKAETLKETVSTLKETEANLIANVSDLQSKLTEQQSIEKYLRQELGESSSRNALHEERITILQDNITESIQASNQREYTATKIAKADAKHATAILEAKLSILVENQERAECRGHQALILANEARKDRNDVLNKISVAIDSVSREREIATRHSTEMKRMRVDVESAKSTQKEELQRVSENLTQMTVQAETSVKSLKIAENQIEEINHKLEEKSTICNKLQIELDLVSSDRSQVSF